MCDVKRKERDLLTFYGIVGNNTESLNFNLMNVILGHRTLVSMSNNHIVRMRKFICLVVLSWGKTLETNKLITLLVIGSVKASYWQSTWQRFHNLFLWIKLLLISIPIVCNLVTLSPHQRIKQSTLQAFRSLKYFLAMSRSLVLFSKVCLKMYSE